MLEPTREVIALLRSEARMRVVLATVAQSSVGTGAAYVALLLIAFDRWDSPWAISLILIAEFAPSMLVGPLLGAAADRWSRRNCAIVADIARAGAFVGIVFVDSFAATLGLALIAGTGTALFRPAMLAALPELVRRDSLPAATSAYGAVTDIGYVVGPALVAGLLAIAGPETVVALNGGTFVVSAIALSRLRFGDAPWRRKLEPSLAAGVSGGVRALRRQRPIAILVACGGAAMLSGGVFNVIELPFAREHLHTGGTGYSALVASYGVGFLIGSISGAGGGATGLLRRRFIQGLAVTGAAGLATAATQAVELALVTFLLCGFGNGLFATYQRLIIQAEVPGNLHGRVFSLDDTVSSWALAFALVCGGALMALAGPGVLMAVAGLWELGLAVVATVALRNYWRDDAASDHGAGVLGQANLREQSSHLVGSASLWLSLLDDLDYSRDDRRVELRPGVGT